VHNTDKVDVGKRVGLQLRKLLLVEEKDLVVDGPRVTAVVADKAKSGTGYDVTMTFSGGAVPFYLNGTHDCTSCCEGAKNAGIIRMQVLLECRYYSNVDIIRIRCY
jgi:hypothetical protein